MQQGELQPATFQGYYKTCEGILKFFDKQRLVSDLAPQDFGALRSHLASRLGVVGLANAITRIKVPFRWAFDNGVIDKPVRYGTEFKAPSAHARRLDRASKHTRLFSAEEIGKLIKAASNVNLRAAISRALDAGIPPATAARVFGTSIGVIMQHYADLDVERADTFLGLGVHVRTMSTAVGAGGTQKEAGQSR